MFKYVFKQLWKKLIVNIILLVSAGVLIFDMFMTDLDSLHRLAFASIIGAIMALVVNNSIIKDYMAYSWIYKHTEAELRFSVLSFMKANMSNEMIRDKLSNQECKYNRILGSKKVDTIITDILGNDRCIAERLDDAYLEVKKCACMLVSFIK